MLRIRLAKMGAKKKPQYRVVVIEQDRARDGRFVEIVGHYDPRKNPAAIRLDTEKIAYWLQKGAQPSDTVRSFLQRQKAEAKKSQEQVA